MKLTITTLAILLASQLATHAAVSAVGSITDDAGTEISNWGTTTPSSSPSTPTTTVSTAAGPGNGSGRTCQTTMSPTWANETTLDGLFFNLTGLQDDDQIRFSTAGTTFPTFQGVSFDVLPEPSRVLLLGLGSLTLILQRRRK